MIADLRAVWPSHVPVVIESDGLTLRDWTAADAPAVVVLFDTPEIDRRTPLESPFDLDAARRYVRQAQHRRREVGSIQLAITEDGATPLGEVLARSRTPPASSSVRTRSVRTTAVAAWRGARSAPCCPASRRRGTTAPSC